MILIVNKVSLKFKKDEIFDLVNKLEAVTGRKMLKVIEYNGNLVEVALKLDNRKENISKEVNDAE